MSTDLIVWAPVQTFNAGPGRPLPFPEVRYRAPKSTMDPRWEACHNHRVACDCREAEMAEQIAELRSEAALARRQEDAIDAVLSLHRAGSGQYCAAPGCFDHYPCPTRNLLAPLSWREQMEAKR